MEIGTKVRLDPEQFTYLADPKSPHYGLGQTVEAPEVRSVFGEKPACKRVKVRWTDGHSSYPRVDMLVVEK